MFEVIMIVALMMRVAATTKQDHPNQTLNFKRVLSHNTSLILASSPTFLKTWTSQEVRLRCVPTSFDYTVTWLRLDGAALPSNRTTVSDFGQVLTLTDVDVTDTGNYRCVVSDGTGNDERTVSLHVDASPFWTHKADDVILSPGQSGTITCKAGGSPEPVITWLINGQLVPTTPPDTDINGGNMYVQGNQLYIQNAHMYDMEMVTCAATNVHGTISKQIYIIVADLAAKLRVPMADVDVIGGRTAVFVCDVIGAPEPIFSWFLNNMSITSSQRHYLSGNTLRLTDVTESDNGVYSCLATNILGKITTKASLIVREATIVSASPNAATVNIDTSFVFRCTVTRNARLVRQVNWYHNGVVISTCGCNQDRFQHENDNSLIFMSVQPSHEGRYECVAKTSFDQAHEHVLLFVKTHPDAPTNVRITRTAAFEVELTWEPGSDGNSPTEHFFIQYLHSGQNNWKFSTPVGPNKTNAVIQLHPWTSYTFRVLQVNSLGVSPPSLKTETFQTAPLPSTSNPRMVEATLNEDGDLLITWQVINRVNGPGFYYLVSWKGIGELNWESTRIPDSTISTKLIQPTGTFEFYDVMVQSRNTLGSGPEPTVYRTK